MYIEMLITIIWHFIILSEYAHWNVNHHIFTVNWHCIILSEYVHLNVNHHILTVNWHLIILPEYVHWNVKSLYFDCKLTFYNFTWVCTIGFIWPISTVIIKITRPVLIDTALVSTCKLVRCTGFIIWNIAYMLTSGNC